MGYSYDILNLQGRWHPDPSCRPRFADLHVIFTSFSVISLRSCTFTSTLSSLTKFTNLIACIAHAPKESKIKPTTEAIKAKEILNLDTGEYCTGSFSSTGGSNGYGSTSMSHAAGGRFAQDRHMIDTTSDERNRQTRP